MPFSSLGLNDQILKAVSDKGYQTPTDIQSLVIPRVMLGRDLVAHAHTGSGKTASYVLPLLQKLKVESENLPRGKRISALILVPTRELAKQVDENIQTYGKNLKVQSMAMFGGTDVEEQKEALIPGLDILVATPGRLIDMLHQRAVYLDELQTLVFDEADRMLDMGFSHDIEKIIERLPEKKQTLLFSATSSKRLAEFTELHLGDAEQVSVENTKENKPEIEQWLITVDKDKKSALLSHLITENNWQQALIFISTKHGSAKLVSQLGKRGIAAESIHSDRSQNMREQVLADFKSGKIKFLITTGVTGRGIDIGELERVINYDLPFEPDEYIHRIGRTGRAGAKGEAISLVSKDDFKNLCAIEGRLNHLIERRDLEEFKATKEVPVSILNYVPKSKPRPSGDKSSRPAGDRKPSKPKSRSKKFDGIKETRSAKTGRKHLDFGDGNQKGKDDPWGSWNK